MNGYWYMDGGDGRRFCWAKSPTYRCPWGDLPPLPTDGSIAPTPEPILAAAIALDMHVDLLYRAIRRMSHGRRMRTAGKLTELCDGCGHRMERVGFRCWIERPATEEELNTGDRIGLAVFGGPPMRTVKSFYMDTKREAQAWAREEARIAKSAASTS